jgi:hypothetical protein
MPLTRAVALVAANSLPRHSRIGAETFLTLAFMTALVMGLR